LGSIRDYHVERKEILRNVDMVIMNLKLFNWFLVLI
jgi:hypothetical protein